VSVPVGNAYDKEATRHPIERRMVDGFAAGLRALLPADPATVLEVGCGEGGQLRKVGDALPGAHLVGIDLPHPDLAERWHGLDSEMVCASATRLPFPDRSFDLVLALEVLEHLDDPDTALTEIARVGRDAVILSVPWEPWWRAGNLARGRYVRELGNTPGHLQHWSSRGFARFVATRFDVRAVRRPVPWTMVAARSRAHG
jgi:SAM-dependent methyltransferase